MKEIPLTQDKWAIVDAQDYEVLQRFNWFAVRRNRAGGESLWYACSMTKVNDKRAMQYMHRVILGATDRSVTVDHVDHTHFGGLDNRRANLRLATQADQNRNTRKQSLLQGTPTSSEYKGVYLDKRRGTWAVSIKVHYQKIWLGSFRSEEDAARAYDAKAEELFGEFAHKNFPEESAT